MENKSIEELQAELEALTKANLEAKIAKEKEKLEAEKKIKEEEELEAQREAMKAELIEELGLNKSKVADTAPVNLNTPNNDFQEFKDVFVKKNNFTGQTYEEIVKRLAYGEYGK